MSGTARSLTYVGPGGNIGSHAIDGLARIESVERIMLIDPDVYEARNLCSQAITQRDIGRPKVDVLAARVRRINPRVQVTTIAAPVQAVPLGRLRADSILTGVDGLAARRCVNSAAWRLGVPWIDAGVRAEGGLARVDVYDPAAGAACLECAWGEAEYAALDRNYPCDGEDSATPKPTNAPAHLGALAAALQCVECLKLLSRDTDDALIGQQLLVDTTSHRHYVSRHQRAPRCRFDHRRWSVQPIPRAAGTITLVQALGLLDNSSASLTRLRVAGDAFVHRLVCPQCNASRDLLRLALRTDANARRCANCAGAMVARGIDTSDTLTLAQRTLTRRRITLFGLGLRSGDVFSIEGPSSEAHFEIGDR